MHNVRAVMIGLITTFVFITMLQTMSGVFWPIPTGLDMNDKRAVEVAQAAAPMAAKLFAVVTFAIAVFVGSFLARKIAGGIRTLPSWIVGGVYTLICILYALGTQFPVWMQIGTMAMPLPAAWLGMTAAAVRPRISAAADVNSPSNQRPFDNDA